MSKINTHAICQLAVCPLRHSASDESEIVSQLLFGDYVTILTDGKPWIQVRNESDGYEGWMDFKQLKFISEDDFIAGTSIKHPVISEAQLILQGPHGNIVVMQGASLPFLEGGSCKIGSDTYTLQSNDLSNHSKSVFDLSMLYLNAPYLWGGKSLFGIDCSGFVQNVFKAKGLFVPRDASKQVSYSHSIAWEEREQNDVVFFTTSSSKVTHVGIMIDKNRIIHAHGRVRIDKCDDIGIFNDEQNKYTHQFHSISRWL